VTLEALHGAADASSAGLAARLPTPIALGPDKRDGIERQVAVYEWMAGFVHSLEAVKAAWPGGVDGRIGTWMLRRLLELLGYVHRAGYVHGAVLPPHVLVHPRDHGATLVGWGTAARVGQPVTAIPRAWSGWYDGPAVSPATDVRQAARSVAWVTSSFDEPMASLVAGLAGGRGPGDAWEALERLEEASRAAYGPPSYNPLAMPGWQ
jgi:hypothetical protein